MKIHPRRILAHLAIVISGMLLVLLGIDRVNNAMNFIENDLTKGLLWVLAICSILNGSFLLRRKKKKGAAPQARPRATKDTLDS